MNAQAAGRLYEAAHAAYALPGTPTIGGGSEAAWAKAPPLAVQRFLRAKRGRPE